MMARPARERVRFAQAPRVKAVNRYKPYLAEHRRFILSWLRFWEA